MAIDFPDSPSTNDTYTVNGRTYIWNGEKWLRAQPELTSVVPTLTVSNDLTVDTDTLHVDSTNNRVGIGTTSPASKTDIYTDSAAGYLYPLTLSAKNASGTKKDYVKIGFGVEQSVAGIEASGLRIQTLRNGATTDALSFTGATNAQTWNFYTEGSSRMTIDTSGNVGIGTTSPTGMLHVSGSDPKIWLTDTDTNADSYVSASSSLGSLILSADENNEVGSSQIAFKVDGSDKMVIQSTGNVGIGTTSPSQTLDVRGIARVGDDANRTPDANGVGHLMIDGSGYGGFVSLDGTAMWVGHNSASRNLNFAIDETARMTLDTSGRLGIGTTSPSKPLHIVYDDPTIQLTDTNTNADSIISANSSVGSLILGADENNEVGSSQIAFKVDGVTRMGLQANGNLEMIGGTVKGDGALVQMVTSTSGASDLTSSANIASITMSPKYSDSTMLVMVNYHAYKYNSSSAVNNTYNLYQFGGSSIRNNSYMVYSSADYMFQGVVSGTIAAGSTSSRTYYFNVSASSTADRIYFYWKTMYVLEIAT